MTNDDQRRMTPAYGSPGDMEDTPTDSHIFVETRIELSTLDSTRIMFLVETTIPERETRKLFREQALNAPRAVLINMAAHLLSHQKTKDAIEKARKDSRERIKIEPIAIGPNDVLPEQPRKITPALFPATRDPDETIPAPPFPVPDTKRTKTLPEAFIPKNNTTPKEFLPKPLVPQTSYSFILNLEKKGKKDGH